MYFRLLSKTESNPIKQFCSEYYVKHVSFLLFFFLNVAVKIILTAASVGHQPPRSYRGPVRSAEGSGWRPSSLSAGGRLKRGGFGLWPRRPLSGVQRRSVSAPQGTDRRPWAGRLSDTPWQLPADRGDRGAAPSSPSPEPLTAPPGERGSGPEDCRGPLL